MLSNLSDASHSAQLLDARRVETSMNWHLFDFLFSVVTRWHWLEPENNEKSLKLTCKYLMISNANNFQSENRQKKPQTTHQNVQLFWICCVHLRFTFRWLRRPNQTEANEAKRSFFASLPMAQLNLLERLHRLFACFTRTGDTISIVTTFVCSHVHPDWCRFVECLPFVRRFRLLFNAFNNFFYFFCLLDDETSKKRRNKKQQKKLRSINILRMKKKEISI